MKYDLSVIIPARKEEFLKDTIENILKQKRGKTEIIAVLDGEWSDPEVEQHPDVNLIKTGISIGQRSATNLGVRLSKSKFIMKLDSHCTWDEGHDVKMMEAFKKVGDNVTMVGVMRNLWMFDWVCECGFSHYQDKGSKCPECGKLMKKDMKMIGKERPQSVSYCFDAKPHFQYFNEYKKRPRYKEMLKKDGLTETLSLQGSCFMATRENYWKWELCDESLGSWGNQGVEVACATWLTKHSVLVNHNTWYAHMFRTKSANDFGFPWPASGREAQKTKQNVKDKFWNYKFSKQKKPISWLIERFYPLKGWTEDDLKKLKEHEKQIEKQ